MSLVSKAVARQRISQPQARESLGTVSFDALRNGSWLGLSTEHYASLYPSIRVIKDIFKTIPVHAVSANAEQVTSAAVEALHRPNRADSEVKFKEKLVVSFLTHRSTYLIVHSKVGGKASTGGVINRNNISGYTFLENPGITRYDNRTVYTKNGSTYTEDQVMRLISGVAPNNLSEGYPPSEIACSWLKLDDYIADYQNGFFENGTVPAGLLTIATATTKDYDDTVDMIEKRHRGAGNTNKLTFQHVPLDPSTGKQSAPQITWTPFAQGNKDIDFKEVYAQVNRKIDTTLGVSQIMQGVDSDAKYSNSEVAKQNLAEQVIDPITLDIWSQFNHELNRITNGMGSAITYKYDIPAISDQQKIKASQKSIDAATMISLVNQGWQLDNIVAAFDYPKEYTLLGEATLPEPEPETVNVDEGSEVNSAPKARKKKEPKAELSRQEQLEQATTQFTESQVAAAVEAVEADQPVVPNPTEEMIAAFIAAVIVVATAAMIDSGKEQNSKGKDLVPEDRQDLVNEFNLKDDTVDGYRAYLRTIASSYSDDTAEKIREVLATAKEEDYSRAETQKALKQVVDLSNWRVKRLARTELNHVLGIGSLESMKQIHAETGVEFSKTWRISGLPGTCPFCKVLDGTTVTLNEPFVPLYGAIETDDDGTFVNNWRDLLMPPCHANGRCNVDFERSDNTKAKAPQLANGEMSDGVFNIKCECGRFIGNTKKSVSDLELKCGNSSCRKLATYNITMLTDHLAKHGHRGTI